MAADSLQIEQDLRVQERSWVVQRIGWTIMLIVLAAALLGAFGNGGPLSRGSASDGNALVVEYERFVHLQRPTALRIRMRHGFHSETASIKFNGDFLRRFQLDKVAPQPESVQIGPEWTTYHFKSDAPGELVVRFDLLPEQIGSLSGRVRADDGNQVAFAQFVFP